MTTLPKVYVLRKRSGDYLTPVLGWSGRKDDAVLLSAEAVRRVQLALPRRTWDVLWGISSELCSKRERRHAVIADEVEVTRMLQAITTQQKRDESARWRREADDHDRAAKGLRSRADSIDATMASGETGTGET